MIVFYAGCDRENRVRPEKLIGKSLPLLFSYGLMRNITRRRFRRTIKQRKR